MNVCEKSKCTLCMACVNKCPQKCICVQLDDIGREYIKIDESNCIRCNRCKQVCHVIQNVDNSKSIAVLAASVINEQEYKTSSSGGVAITIAKETLRKNGVVYASSFANNQVCVNRYTSLEEIESIKGSKYVISYMNNTLSEIETDLLAGKDVCFIGTPCQCASLKTNIKSSHFICVDLICHGVPPQLYLNEYLREIKKKNNINSDAENVSFRRGNEFSMQCFMKDGAIIEESLNYSVYLKGFMKGLFYREACYECKYANCNRVGDITIGDFWGIGNLKSKCIRQRGEGLSLVLLNTNAGIEIWNAIKEKFYYEERLLDEAVNGNTQLQMPSQKHRNYNRFLALYKKYGFYISAKKCIRFDMLKSRIRERIINGKL